MRIEHGKVGHDHRHLKKINVTFLNNNDNELTGRAMVNTPIRAHTEPTTIPRYVLGT